MGTTNTVPDSYEYACFMAHIFMTSPNASLQAIKDQCAKWGVTIEDAQSVPVNGIRSADVKRMTTGDEE